MIEELVIKGKHRICLLILDGLGDAQTDGGTPLEKAKTPNIDSIAPQSSMGLLDPVSPGVSPGSGPGHLSIFGYDPVQHQIGRGILEALGVGVEVGKDDLCLRANFATIKDDIITDRRAGRIPTEENIRLCKKLSSIEKIEDIKITIKPGKEHRFVVIFNGHGLDSQITDADPQKSGKKKVIAKALSPDAEKATQTLNEFINRAANILADESRANYVLLRGAATHPGLKKMTDRYKMKCLALATYPMYLGIARLLGMEAINPGPEIHNLFEAYTQNISEYDFFFIHIKETDKAGEDGDFEQKVKVIEQFDHNLKTILDNPPEVLAITCDHSTPVKLASHSWHPCPVLIKSEFCRSDQLSRFTEKNCACGSISRLPAINLMPILLSNALRLKKYGA